ncbi:hypothetical protein Anapl_17471 [Anas platyrhynchos]|uniref:Uncharacterized protein n=1 Tax=Anas platyrhynchos TaxID=8839 RepID=R0KM87_ANAPL|nr:hypothetical protein Anapl_17471 [Anas platyrhynchos]
MKPHEAQDSAPSLGLVTSGRRLVETTHCAKGKCRTPSGTITIRPGSSTAVTGLHHTAEEMIDENDFTDINLCMNDPNLSPEHFSFSACISMPPEDARAGTAKPAERGLPQKEITEHFTDQKQHLKSHSGTKAVRGETGTAPQFEEIPLTPEPNNMREDKDCPTHIPQPGNGHSSLGNVTTSLLGSNFPLSSWRGMAVLLAAIHGPHYFVPQISFLSAKDLSEPVSLLSTATETLFRKEMFPQTVSSESDADAFPSTGRKHVRERQGDCDDMRLVYDSNVIIYLCQFFVHKQTCNNSQI